MKTQPNSAVEHAKAFVRSAYAWPGGYPKVAIMADGNCLCHACVVRNARRIVRSTAALHAYSDGWTVLAVDVNWEDADLLCAECSTRIESAYAEDEAQARSALVHARWEAVAAATERAAEYRPGGGGYLPPAPAEACNNSSKTGGDPNDE